MKIIRLLLTLPGTLLCVLVLNTGCVSAPIVDVSDEPVPRNVLPEGQREQAATDPLFIQAKEFDAWVSGKMEDSERASLQSQCEKNSKAHAFCFSFLRPKEFARSIRRTQPTSPSYAPKTYPETPIELVNGKVKNWNKLRKADVQSLLPETHKFGPSELEILARLSIKETRCPNPMAVAVAATLEDLLPKEANLSGIAQLYEKGARCAPKNSDDREHWATRAALFYVAQKKFDSAERILSKIEPQDFFSGRARFWLWRVRQTMGKQAEADLALQRLRSKHPFSFHTTVAELLTGADPGERLLKKESNIKKRSSNAKINSLIEQCEILNRFGFLDSCSVLVDWGFRKFPSTNRFVKMYLASLGNANDQVSRVFPLLMYRPSLTNEESMRILYPLAYPTFFSQYAGGNDKYLLLAIARKESVFDPYAISTANAQGIMQLNPVTAKRISGSDLHLVDVRRNIAIASRYVESLLSQFSGHLPSVIASYNAGEEKVAEWKNRFAVAKDPILFIDLIPYRETRTYVGFVLNNYFWYRRIHEGDRVGFLEKLFQSTMGVALK